MTTSLPALTRLPRAFGGGRGRSFWSVGVGISARTSLLGLSSRRPLKAACRTLPSPVQPANSISATSFGSTQFQSAFLCGVPFPPNGLRSVLSDFSFLRRPAEVRSLNPVPTRALCTRWSPRKTPTIQDRRWLALPVQPPITTSCPPRHFDLCQLSVRPES